MRFLLAQLNLKVGDISYNTQRLSEAILIGRNKLADVIVFPELAITGYPPEDLLFRKDFMEEAEQALQTLCHCAPERYVIVGHPRRDSEGACYNSASVLYNGAIIATYDKQCLPNYAVFDEKRYFKPGQQSCVVSIKGIPCGILICEDLWHPEPSIAALHEKAQVLITLNASPFNHHQAERRLAALKARVSETGLPILYTNLVGGQDELVFDGGSLVMNAAGDVIEKASFFEEECRLVTLSPTQSLPYASGIPELYQALVLGTRDYLQKNHFPGALLGLSGGIDSALTLAIACDAIGADKVEAVMMPSRHTSELSLKLAQQQAAALQVSYRVLSIESIYEAFLKTLEPIFAAYAPNTAEENLQARCRGALLMALSNKLGKVVLTTGNKSELAMGYATLYGDMAGGFDVLKDVYKTQVYALAHYRNEINPVIPQAVIDRAPSAELAPNQTDQDTLPPYPLLDAILEAHLEHNQGQTHLEAAGFPADIVRKVLERVKQNEYKRRQSAPGVRVSPRGFGKDWRMPITSGYPH